MTRQPRAFGGVIAAVLIAVLLAVAALGAAIALGTVRGSPLWTVAMVLVVAVCPVLIVGIYLMSERPLPVPVDPTPPTRAASLNWLAPWYDAACVRLRLDARFRARVLEAAGLRGDERVLDIGCTTGALASEAAQRLGAKGEVWGVDPAPDMVRLAMQRGCATTCRPRFRTGLAEQLPFDGQSFDVVLASLVLMRLPPDLKPKALAEARRVLKDGGRLVVVELDRPATALWRALTSPLRLAPSLAAHLNGRTHELLASAGFGPAEIVGRWGPLLTVWQARRL